MANMPQMTVYKYKEPPFGLDVLFSYSTVNGGLSTCPKPLFPHSPLPPPMKSVKTNNTLLLLPWLIQSPPTQLNHGSRIHLWRKKNEPCGVAENMQTESFPVKRASTTGKHSSGHSWQPSRRF